MEKRKRENSVLAGAAELFDLPADMVAGAPHVEVVGNGHFYLENHRGVLSYSGEEIAVSSEGMVVRVLGRGLELVSMTGDALRIRGEIQRVEWER